MLATLFDFPFEDRRKLSFWSDCATAVPEAGGYIDSEAKREEVFAECLAYFTRLWNERVNAEPRPDLISMLAHGEATRNMTPREYLGNLILLIVGGNDTTRNSISGGVLFLNQNPGEYAKLRANPGLIETHGAGDHPLPDAAGAYAPHRAAGRRARRPAHQKPATRW